MPSSFNIIILTSFFNEPLLHLINYDFFGVLIKGVPWSAETSVLSAISKWIVDLAF